MFLQKDYKIRREMALIQ